MRQLVLFACAVLFCAGCSVQRPLLPSAAFQLQNSSKFFGTPPSDLIDNAASASSR
jgi:hypothetical protein